MQDAKTPTLKQLQHIRWRPLSLIRCYSPLGKKLEAHLDKGTEHTVEDFFLAPKRPAIKNKERTAGDLAKLEKQIMQ